MSTPASAPAPTPPPQPGPALTVAPRPVAAPRGSPFLPFVVCAVTFFASAALLGGVSGPEATAFWTLPEARLWHLFVSLQPALWLSSFLVVWPDFRDARRTVLPQETRHRVGAALCFTLALAAAALPLTVQELTGTSLLPRESELATRMSGFFTKMTLMGVVGTVAAAVHAFGILCIHARLFELAHAPPTPDLEDEVREYQRLRSQLRRFLGYSAAIIGLATLSTGALRNLILDEVPGTRFSPALVMAYGTFFSALLALIFVPAHRTLTAVGDGLAERLLHASLGTRERWSEWKDEHQAIRAHLGLEDSALKTLQDSIAVLAPLVGSLSALVL